MVREQRCGIGWGIAACLNLPNFKGWEVAQSGSDLTSRVTPHFSRVTPHFSRATSLRVIILIDQR